VLAKHRIIPPSFTLLVFRKKQKILPATAPRGHAEHLWPWRPSTFWAKRSLVSRDRQLHGRTGALHVMWRCRNSKEKTTTRRSRTRWVVLGREGSALLGPKVGRTATPGPWGGCPATIGVWGWPEPGGGLRANPSVWVSRTVGRAVTHLWPRSTPTLTPPADPLVAISIVVAAVAGWVW